jgi:formate hydrogenlyase subunit 6/NADH:ubiquinone oxidoreductase subunit I
MDCPANAIQVTMLDRKTKRFVMDYHTDRCAFCGQCTLSCRHGALSMASDEWELAQLDRTSFLIHFGDPSDVKQVLAGMSQARAGEVEHS